MDLNEYIPKWLRELAKAADKKPTSNPLAAFGKGRVKLSRYYEHWRAQIRKASEQQRILSNGWAFSTLSGIAAFETYVGGEPAMHSLYADRVGEIEALAETISSQVGPRPFGAMVYGYGNLIREAQWLEHLVRAGVLTARHRIYLLDCSLFYHVFAKSDLNPLRNIFRPRRLHPELIDCFNGQAALTDLTYARDDLHAAQPTIHILLGNTFGNVVFETLKKLLEAVVRPSDFLIAEYANYTSEFLSKTDPDYVSEMAKRAAAEMFYNQESAVTVTNKTDAVSRYTELEVLDPDTKKRFKFKSMLRRAFKPAELTALGYEHIDAKSLANQSVSVDVFRRTRGA